MQALGKFGFVALLAPLLWVVWHDAGAHAQGEDYVFTNLGEDSITGNVQINLDDLREKLGLDLPGSKEAASEVLEATAPKVHAYIRKHLSIAPRGGDPYEFEFTTTKFESAQGDFAVYNFVMPTGPLPDFLEIEHTMLYEGDRFHRGLFLVDYNARTGRNYGEEYTALVFSPGNTRQTLDLNNIPGLLDRKQMIWQGVVHIWIGIDHILFLVSLILPTVLVRRSGRWQPEESFSRAFLRLLSVVTVFTVAHSVSLLLAALDIVELSSRLVESMIALSIVLVALNNIFVKVKRGSLWIIMVLGLFHGLGFASVLGNLPFRMVDLVQMVLMFNIGVELGQIAIVAVIFPVLFSIRKQSYYVPVVLIGGSTLLAVVAMTWFVQRALGLG